jgi:beta-xylosidase
VTRDPGWHVFGRETYLVPVMWVGGWPVVGELLPTMAASAWPLQPGALSPARDDFDEAGEL